MPNKTGHLLTLFVLIVAAAAMLAYVTYVTQLVSSNMAHAKIIKKWMEASYQGHKASALQDGIPDEWDVVWWGGAVPAYYLKQGEARAGNFAMEVQNASEQGAVALVQTIPVTPDARLICTVSVQGAGAALQFRFRALEATEWMPQGWLDIAPGGDWQTYQLAVSTPFDAGEARLFLRTSKQSRFDEVYVSVEKDGQMGLNLLKNPGFEQDGIVENPLAWWEEHVKRNKIAASPDLDPEERLSYLNITDMLAGRYGAIRERARQLDDRCVLAPDMTSWLIARGPEFEQTGGAAARERLYQLAIELAPNCPQPQAALAGLYESHQAFGRAAELYHRAAELSGDTAQAGRYYFDEGLLHVRYTGDWEQAVKALQQAERLSGWEGGGPWYRGVATLNLGIALEMLGRDSEARAAYQRVLDCASCSYHHSTARDRLYALGTSRD